MPNVKYITINETDYPLEDNATRSASKVVVTDSSGKLATSGYDSNSLVTEAPSDNKQYARKNGAWNEIVIPENKELFQVTFIRRFSPESISCDRTFDEIMDALENDKFVFGVEYILDSSDIDKTRGYYYSCEGVSDGPSQVVFSQFSWFEGSEEFDEPMWFCGARYRLDINNNLRYICEEAGYATEEYVDNAIATAIGDAIGGSY